mmetsp:Transcript_14542/g.18371  ORF Transcript_14542/g.18371 Transcript_14542/m.18371 type:complete len:252 (+) Transcript_14542:214-969(+)
MTIVHWRVNRLFPSGVLRHPTTNIYLIHIRRPANHKRCTNLHVAELPSVRHSFVSMFLNVGEEIFNNTYVSSILNICVGLEALVGILCNGKRGRQITGHNVGSLGHVLLGIDRCHLHPFIALNVFHNNLETTLFLILHVHLKQLLGQIKTAVITLKRPRVTTAVYLLPRTGWDLERVLCSTIKMHEYRFVTLRLPHPHIDIIIQYHGLCIPQISTGGTLTNCQEGTWNVVSRMSLFINEHGAILHLIILFE